MHKTMEDMGDMIQKLTERMDKMLYEAPVYTAGYELKNNSFFGTHCNSFQDRQSIKSIERIENSK